MQKNILLRKRNSSDLQPPNIILTFSVLAIHKLKGSKIATAIETQEQAYNKSKSFSEFSFRDSPFQLSCSALSDSQSALNSNSHTASKKHFRSFTNNNRMAKLAFWSLNFYLRVKFILLFQIGQYSPLIFIFGSNSPLCYIILHNNIKFMVKVIFTLVPSKFFNSLLLLKNIQKMQANQCSGMSINAFRS